MRDDPNLASCPLCNLGEKGNQRHLHTVCSHPHLLKVRIYLHNILEKALQDMFRTSDEISRIAGLQPDSNLYPTMFRKLQNIELQHPTIQSSQAKYRSTNILINNLRSWRLSIESFKQYNMENNLQDSASPTATNEIIQLPDQHPFSLTLGLTGRATNVPWSSDVFKISTVGDKSIPVTSPLDKLYVGLIPRTMDQAVVSFLKISHHANLPDLTNDLKQKWRNVQKLIRAKPIIIQRNIRGLLSVESKQWKNNIDKVSSPINQSPAPTPSTTSKLLNQSTKMKDTSVSLKQHLCSGTLCQIRVLHGVSTKNHVKRIGQSCIECMEEERGWIVARQVEEEIKSRKRRELTEFTSFIDKTCNKATEIHQFWTMIRPFVEKIQPVANMYVSTNDYPREGHLREVIEIFATTFCIRLRPSRHYWSRNNLMDTTVCKNVLLQLQNEGRSGYYRLSKLLQLLGPTGRNTNENTYTNTDNNVTIQSPLLSPTILSNRPNSSSSPNHDLSAILPTSRNDNTARTIKKSLNYVQSKPNVSPMPNSKPNAFEHYLQIHTMIHYLRQQSCSTHRKKYLHQHLARNTPAQIKRMPYPKFEHQKMTLLN